MSDALLMHIILLAWVTKSSYPTSRFISSFPSSFARKIVPPKWSAAVYRTTVTAYLGSGNFPSTREDVRWKCSSASLRYFTARVHAIIVFLGRIDQSTGPAGWPSPSVLLRDPSRGRKIRNKREKSATRICSIEKGKFSLCVARCEGFAEGD